MPVLTFAPIAAQIFLDTAIAPAPSGYSLPLWVAGAVGGVLCTAIGVLYRSKEALHARWESRIAAQDTRIDQMFDLLVQLNELHGAKPDEHA